MSEFKAAALTYCEVGTVGQVRSVSWPQDSAVDLGEFQVGREIGERYRLRSELGKGGMGCVFLAYDKTLDRNVALKVEIRRSAKPGEDLALAREARLAALLAHEGIASVYDFGIHAGRPFTIFEYVDGKNLREVMKTRGAWPVADVISLMEPLTNALDFAHAEGVIHSDLKPENICLKPNGSPKVLDFGIARNLKADSDTGLFRGTAAYASPEQAGCRPTDGRSDQYALGLITYELLAGRRPFLSNDALTQLHAHEHESPPSLLMLRSELPAGVAGAVMRSLEKDPSNRFATCREFFSTLSAATDPRGPRRGREPNRRAHQRNK